MKTKLRNMHVFIDFGETGGHGLRLSASDWDQGISVSLFWGGYHAESAVPKNTLVALGKALLALDDEARTAVAQALISMEQLGACAYVPKPKEPAGEDLSAAASPAELQ
jgi:hypothetical protein